MIGLKRGQIVRSLLAILLIGLSWWGIFTARAGLVVRSLERDHVPMLYLAPQQGHNAPGVLIAHGFAGSKQLMLGYGHVLAKAGYAVMLWDFDGHGANPTTLKGFELRQNLEVALQGLIEQPEVDHSRLALLGHSMGSGVVMSAGIQNLERFAATIAISPTGQNVTPQAPRNLQLQIGDWEGGLLPYAQRLLADAGGVNSQFAQGRARELVTVPTVEHITILFSQASHQAALRWLDSTFGRQSQSEYVDRRMIWYFLHLVGWLLLLSAIAPYLAPPATDFKISPWRSWGGLIASPIVALGGLLLLNPLIDLQVLGGVQVGGAVGVWFLIAGLAWLGILGQLPRLSGQMAGVGVMLFALLWVAVGAMAQVVWLQWWLIPARLTIWLPIAIACFPWFLASGMVQQDTRWQTRLAWWFGQSVMMIAGFLLVIVCLPKLGFMFLLLPLFPLVMALFAVMSSLFNQAWIYAIANTLFFAWLLAAGFPLSACCLAFG